MCKYYYGGKFLSKREILLELIFNEALDEINVNPKFRNEDGLTFEEQCQDISTEELEEIAKENNIDYEICKYD